MGDVIVDRGEMKKVKIEVKQVDSCVLGSRLMCSSSRCNGVYARLTIECLLVEELKIQEKCRLWHS